MTPGASPGQLVVDPDALAPEISAFSYGPDAMQERSLASLDEVAQLRKEDQVLWLHIVGLGDAGTIRHAGEMFGLHALALEDVVNRGARAKMDDYDNHGFFLLQSLYEGSGADTTPVAVFWGAGFVVTFQDHPTGCWEAVRERIRSGRGRIRNMGADYLAYALADVTIDHFFPTVEQRLDQLGALEEAVARPDAPDPVAEIAALKRDLIQLRRAVFPLREALTKLLRVEDELVSEPIKPFLRDALDHVLQLVDLIDAARDTANNLIAIHMSLLGQRTNDIMRVLTIIATIFIPLTFVAGLYGMNFAGDKSPLNMPELRWYYGYPAALILMALLAGGLFYFFVRRGWIGKKR